MSRGQGPRYQGKALYNRAERDAYHSFVQVQEEALARAGLLVVHRDGTVGMKGGQKGFRAYLRDRRMKVPHHYARQARRSRESWKAERRFVEEALLRGGRYLPHDYPSAGGPADEGDSESEEEW